MAAYFQSYNKEKEIIEEHMKSYNGAIREIVRQMCNNFMI